MYYKIRAVIQPATTNDGSAVWALGLNAFDDLGNGKGKKVSDLLPYVHAFESRAEAFESLKVVLNNRCKPLLDLTNRKFKRTETETKDDMSFYEWEEIERI